MAKVPLDIAGILSNPDLSILANPFAPGKLVIKRSSFPKGKTPPHLVSYLIKAGECKGQKGKTVYKGVSIPNAAVCVAKKHKRG